MFPKVFASRRPKDIEGDSAEFKARNILTAIDKMNADHPNIRPIYETLSEDCHPNSLGVFSHFSNLFDDKRAVFDDGQDMADVALHHLIFCGLMFGAEETVIGDIQTVIDAILSDYNLWHFFVTSSANFYSNSSACKHWGTPRADLV